MIATSKPSVARSSAVARPMPESAPVTIASRGYAPLIEISSCRGRRQLRRTRARSEQTTRTSWGVCATQASGTATEMRVVVIGASGNVGTATIDALLQHPSITHIVAVARRLPDPGSPASRQEVEWRSADIRHDPLDPIVDGADAVIHLAWLFHPSHRPEKTWDNNVVGTVRLLEAVERCNVPVLVVSSSVAAYSPREERRRVSRSPGRRTVRRQRRTHGRRPTSSDCSTASRLECPRAGSCGCDLRSSSTNAPPASSAGSSPVPCCQGASYGLRSFRCSRSRAGLLLQTVHADDVGRAFAASVGSVVAGPFNLCADQLLDTDDLAQLFGAKPVTVPPAFVKAVLRAAWTVHAVPAAPDLFDALMRVPVMSNERAKTELGWKPRVSASDAIRDFLAGLQSGAGYPTPPLDPHDGWAVSVKGGCHRRRPARLTVEGPQTHLERPQKAGLAGHAYLSRCFDRGFAPCRGCVGRWTRWSRSACVCARSARETETYALLEPRNYACFVRQRVLGRHHRVTFSRSQQ